MNIKEDLKDIHEYNTSTQITGFLVRYTSNLWQSYIEKALQPFSLSYTQFVVLATLGWLRRNDQPVSIGELTKKAELDHSTTSQAVLCLAAKKLIELSQLVDSETINLLVTAEGWQLVEKAFIAVEKADYSFFKEELIDQEIEDIIQIFRKVTKNW